MAHSTAYHKLWEMISQGKDISKTSIEALEELHIPYLQISCRDYENGTVSGRYVNSKNPEYNFEFENADISLLQRLPQSSILAEVQEDICTFYVNN